MVRLII